MTTKELKESLIKHAHLDTKCNFIKYHTSHYNLYFTLKRVKKKPCFEGLLLLPFFKWRFLIVKYSIYLCIIVYIMYRIDKWMDLGSVSIFALPIPHLFIIIFIYILYTKRIRYIVRYDRILYYNIKYLSKLPNIIIFKEKKDKKNNKYIRKANYKKKK